MNKSILKGNGNYKNSIKVQNNQIINSDKISIISLKSLSKHSFY